MISIRRRLESLIIKRLFVAWNLKSQNLYSYKTLMEMAPQITLTPIRMTLRYNKETTMECCEKGLCLIKEFEGCRLKAYRCPAGVWTIGFGWTPGVKPGDVWTQEHANEMLVTGVKPYAAAVAKACPHTTQNEFDAMTSLCYNIGPGNFAKSSVVRLHNAGDRHGAANAFLKWNRGGGKILAGLDRRRKAERALYLA